MPRKKCNNCGKMKMIGDPYFDDVRLFIYSLLLSALVLSIILFLVHLIVYMIV